MDLKNLSPASEVALLDLLKLCRVMSTERNMPFQFFENMSGLIKAKIEEIESGQRPMAALVVLPTASAAKS